MTDLVRTTAPTREDVVDLVRSALAVVCGCDRGAISAELGLDALGVDSLGRVALAEIVEEQLADQLPDLHISDADLGAFVSVDDVVRYLVALL